LYFFLKSLPLPLTTHNIGSVESVGVPIFLAGQKRYACPGTRFLVHPLHWGFGNLVAADHSRVSEWRDCLDFDAERYLKIFEDATNGAGRSANIRDNLYGNARIFDAEQALEAGIVHEVQQARLPDAGVTSHWWN
jgi:ATP-dependent protease ClpP protease subunit